MRRGVNALPPGRIVWSVAEVAEVLGWTTTRTRRWLKRERACTRRGAHYYTCRSQLRRAFPGAADEVIANLPE